MSAKAPLTFIKNVPALHMERFTKDEVKNLEATLPNVLPGDTVSFPVEAIKRYNESFNREAKIGIFERALNLAFPVATVALPTAVSTLFGPTATAVTALIAANLVPIVGHALESSHQKSLKDKVWHSNHNIGMHAQAARWALTDAANENFVRQYNERVASGEKLSLNELAQLVNVHAGYFENACEDLAITVLSAKAALAMQEGKIERYKIESSSNRSFAKGEHSDLTLMSLWQQHNNQVITMKTPKEIHSDGECDTDSGDSFKKAYIDGLKGMVNAVFRKNPKAEDHLRKVDDTFTVPAVQTAPNLETSIRAYGVNSLDLPALEPTAFK